ncbi:uncharacterized protein EV422DRAFT_502475 [Fimicolochytrium jonesii]|uniref:uncharacterized protein n=1 Tax=Fimicolochytrium jonesii TaxID=1396493 RepID=UPI0022FF2E37|nr:uncharacterized protein EV422DRAFT_502475 [Fimicolochytrium jonesii]KAI8826712.1 hypothetical protein EV422DRAFT_502475 [Fimicolochytrium jonesii]
MKATANSWGAFYQQNRHRRVRFVHLVVFVDAFKLYRNRINNLTILAVPCAELQHGFRNVKTSHAMAPLSLMDMGQKDSLGTDFCARILANELHHLTKGIWVFNAFTNETKPCIVVPFAVVGDGPGRTSFLGFKQSSDLTRRPCHVCMIMRDHLIMAINDHQLHAERCQCAQSRSNTATTVNVVEELCAAWMDVGHGDHPALQNAEQYGITFPSYCWLWPGLKPTCLAAIDMQHSEGEGEVEKEWKQFAAVLMESHGPTFWSTLNRKYRAFCERNGIKQPQIKTMNHWMFGQTHKNKLAFVLRSFGVLREFVQRDAELLPHWVSGSHTGRGLNCRGGMRYLSG